MFHPRTGELVLLSNGNRTAQRSHPSEEFNNAVVMSLEPLRDNHVFEVKLDKKVNSWTGTIEIGVTTCDPNVLEFPATAAVLPHYSWLISGKSLLRDSQPIIEEYVQDLETLDEGDRVGVMRTSDGELHFYINGVSQGVADVNIPNKVFAVVDLYGKCAQVTVLETTNESRIYSNALSNINTAASHQCSSVVGCNNNNNNTNNNNNGISSSDTNSETSNTIPLSIDSGSCNVVSDRMHFHERTGTLVKLSNCFRTAERRRPHDEFNNGVVMSHRPLCDDELFEIRIDRLVDKWSGSIEVGITTHNPATLEFPATMTNMRSGTIMMSGCGILTNGKGTRREYGEYNLDELVEGDRISLMRKNNGNLHYYINGMDQGVAATKVPQTVFAVVDLYGMTVKVTIVDRDDRIEQVLVNHRNNMLIREYQLLCGITALEDSLEDASERLVFSSRCGSHAAIINGGRTAHRPVAVEDFDNAVVLTSRPLKANEIFEVRLDAVVPKWAGSVEIGVTTHSPQTLEFPSTMTNVQSGTWMLTAKGTVHNGQTMLVDYCGNLDFLTVGSTVGATIADNGDLHFFVNGVDQGIAASNVTEEVYGVVDLYGQATRCSIVDHSDAAYDCRLACEGLLSPFDQRFHHLRGRNARISNGGLTASRPNNHVEFNDAVVVSSRPLHDGELFEVVLDKIVDRWCGSLGAGVTTIKPENFEFPATMTDMSSGMWMLSGSSLIQNGSTVRSGYGCDLDTLESNTRLGMMRTADDTLHYYMDGVDMGAAFTDLPKNLYVVFDLYGQCAQVCILPPLPLMIDSITSPPTHTETLRPSLGETTDATHTFSPCCGKNITLHNNNSVATRVRGYNHGIVFSGSLLQPNELFEVQIQEIFRRWSGSLQLGFTTLHYNDAFPTSTLPPHAGILLESGDTWLLIGTQARHNGVLLKDNYGPSLERLDVGDRVGIKRCLDGTMHAFYNGQDIGVAARNLPKKLYAVVDIYGAVTKVAITSKTLCGVTPVEATRDCRGSIPSSHSRDSLEHDLELCHKSVHGVLEFHENHGRNVALSGSNSAACRTSSYNHGVVFSRKPLVRGQLFQVRVERLNPKWSSSLRIGVTTQTPSKNACLATALGIRKSTWIIAGDGVFQNGVKVKGRYGSNLDCVQVRHLVGVTVDATNQLHLYVNGMDQGVAAKELPQQLYAVLDLYGQCEEVVLATGDGLGSGAVETSDREKADLEHGWKEKVSRPPFVDQLFVKNCEYQNACIRFKSSLGLPDGYFLHDHIICYCDTCYKIRGDEAYYRKGEPPKDYAVPFGWCQFLLRIPTNAETSGILDKWHVAFHGTRPTNVRRILDCGDLLIQDTMLSSKNASSKNKSKDMDDEAIQICFSPTIRYAASSTFTPKYEFCDPKTRKRLLVKIAFQVFVQPGAYNSGPQRSGVREPVDGHFSNSDIEWFTKEKGAIILHSLLIHVDGL